MHFVTNEIPLDYGKTFLRHLTRLYDLRITYPNVFIFLFDDDITGAFRHIKYNLFIAGAFAFIANEQLIIPTAQTFGSTTSPANYEPLAQARAWLSCKFSSPSFSHLREKHKLYLDQISFPHDTNSTISKICKPDLLNTGIPSDGPLRNTQHFPYVDDTLYSDTEKKHEKSHRSQ